ncbi:MAG: hypothetical protein N3E40_07090, partial [Dehalococcoidia bacterium]|nr:hypothetical protein [Dehalococcoidia bacterium]
MDKNNGSTVTAILKRITVGVKGLDGALCFFRDYVGMKVVGDTMLSPDYHEKIWNLTEGTGARSVRLRHGRQPTQLELVKFDGISCLPIRAPDNTRDYGFYDLGFVVQNLDSIYGKLRAKGFSSLSEPVNYAPFGNLTREVVIIGPEGIPVV